jgi:translation initiation factor IF-2
MRLVQVAKILGMTGQQLRKELTDVNFGVKPTDREVPDNLASGIIRFLARKHNLNIDLTNLDALILKGGEMEKEEDEESMPPSPEEKEEAEEVPEAEKPVAAPKQNLNVLRKLTLEGVSQEAIAKQRSALAKESRRSSSDANRSRGPRHPVLKKKPAQNTIQEQIKKKEGTVMLPEQISVKEFAEKTGIQVPKVIQALMKNGVLANINQMIDYDTAAIVATELDVKVQREESSVSVEALLKSDLASLTKDEPENLKPRPPIVTVMGHVDHGKTAILDAIRETNVVAGEAGGITQHIGAYQVLHDGKSITFLDTPGHEAFTAMRARGAQVTDIAILVVSAEEGVKPTTIEAINHAKDADVPIIVALNKIDRPNADVDRVKGELASHGLQPEDWGGTVPMIPCSAVTKQGIPDLLEHILIVAELKELKANPNRAAVATVIESHLDSSLGPVATVIVNTGTLHMGDVIASGMSSGRVKVLFDAHENKLTEVGPSGPARIAGLSEVPQVGDILQVFSSDKEARAFVDAYLTSKAHEGKHGFADLVSRLTEGKLSQLKIILKADAQGSVESIQEALRKLTSDQVQAKVIHSAVGDITESDVMMASASEGIVLGFHVDASPAVFRTAEREGIEIRQYDIIYKLLEEVDLLLKGLVEPDEEEEVTGHLEVRGVFLTKKSEQIIGGKVTDGTLKRLPFRLMRGSQQVGTGRITSLKQVERDIKEAKEGMECGLKVDTDFTIELGDILEVYRKEFKKTKEE